MAIPGMVQFELALGRQNLWMGRKNIVPASVVAFSDVDGDDSVPPSLYTVDAANGLLTVSSEYRKPWLFLRFEHNNPDPPLPGPIQTGAEGDLPDRATAVQVIGQLRAYVQDTTPANASTVAAVKLLCRVAIFMIRRMF